jgi:DNA primase catalytic core
MAGSGTPGRRRVNSGEPGLAAEKQFWREWNADAYARAAARGDIPGAGPEQTQALRRRAEALDAVTRRGPGRNAELVQIHAAAGRFFQACLHGSWVGDYLGERGLSAALLPSSPWKIGYAPATWTALTDHLRRQGYPSELMLASGLVTTGRDGHLRDRFRDRLMIPLRDEHGVAIAFIGRRHPDAGDDKGPKYLNSPGTDLYTKSHILAGLAESRRSLARGAQPVLVEGPMDALAVSIAAPGQFTGIAPCGTALTAEQVAALTRAVDLPGCGVRVALDPDTVGRAAAIRAYPLLQPVTADITAVLLPDGRDPADILKADGREALRDALADSVCPLADLVVDARIEDWAHGGELDISRQVDAFRAAAATVAAMPPAEAPRQIGRLSALFIRQYDWTPEEINRELIAAIEQRYEDPSPVGLPAHATQLTQAAIAPATEVPAPRRTSSPASVCRTAPARRARAERG